MHELITSDKAINIFTVSVLRGVGSGRPGGGHGPSQYYMRGPKYLS